MFMICMLSLFSPSQHKKHCTALKVFANGDVTCTEKEWSGGLCVGGALLLFVAVGELARKIPWYWFGASAAIDGILVHAEGCWAALAYVADATER